MKTYIVHLSLNGVRMDPISVECHDIAQWLAINCTQGEEVVSIAEMSQVSV